MSTTKGEQPPLEYHDERRDFTLTATGDLFITRKLSPYTEQAYLRLWDIVRSANIRFTNFEMLIHEFEGYPVAESGGTYTQVDPSIIDDMLWAGFNLLSLANNHSLDYALGGMMRTIELLDEAGLCHAGTGENLSDARSPRYLDLDEGRVALLSASSTFASFGRAGEARRDLMGRPGLNPVRYSTYYVIDQAAFNQLRQVSENMGLEAMKREYIAAGYLKPDKEGEINFAGSRFVVGDKPGVYTEIDKSDQDGNLKWISDARRQSDFVVFSLHAHEGGMDRWQPATFHQPFARACIDAGTDAFLGHGPHFVRGIEIYKQKPIFYSLGNFVFQNETVRKLPADSYERMGLDDNATPADYYDKRSNYDQKGFPADAKYWESFVPWCRYEGGALVECRLYPVTLGFGKPRTVRGRPMLAEGQLAEKIIAKVAELSKPFGTEIRYEDGVGIVLL
jgi:poly-gamma-glutamate synthesis protein (capsule biosynthesis protein)